MEAALDGVAEGLDRPRLGQPRCPFNQQVTIGEQGYEQSLDKVGLAHYLLIEPFLELSQITGAQKSSRPVDALPKKGALV